MTSKDGIEILKSAWHNRMDKPNYPNFDDIDEALTSVAKDLEVLEIIKSHIIKKTFIMGSDYDECNAIQFEVAIKELKPYIQENIKCTPITICNNSFTLIKEWLGGEQ